MGAALPHHALETAEHSTVEGEEARVWTCGSQLGMLLTYVARGLSQKYLKVSAQACELPGQGQAGGGGGGSRQEG